jgi:glycosyltransferase involved in cell wall biosynthesis
VDLRARVITIAKDPSPGVNLVGFLEAEAGLGEVARKLGRGLERAGIPFAAIPYRRTPSRQNHPLQLETSGIALYDTNLICLNADELPSFASDVSVEFFAGRYSIGMWFWETSVFRERDRTAYLLLDEVWTPSDYVRDAVARRAHVPVLVAPLPIERPAAPALSREDLGLPPGFVFLFLFDFVSAERKNPLAVVEAFRRAFAPGEGPTLVLKSINGRERKPHELERLETAASGRPDIVVLDGYVSAAERDAFLASCDCFVSLHRSEGFGLTMAEAMSHGKPVIATGYSGNLEFMDERTCHLVPYDLVEVPEQWWAHTPGAQWADPDLDAAAESMRRVFEDEEAARRRGELARAEILRRFPIGRTADFIGTRFRASRERFAPRAASDLHAQVIRAAQGANRGVGLGAPERLGRGPIGLLRRLAVRALWPYLEDQHRFDTEVVDALARLQRASRRSGGA